MSNAPEEFEKLQKLLKVKRYEQPPPGFFNNFSDKVVNRIEAAHGEADRAWSQASWWKKFMMLLETNPIAAGVFGVSVCGLLISGITYSQSRPTADLATASDVSLDVADASAAMPASWSKLTKVDSTAPSINPMFGTNVTGSLFGLEQLKVQQVSFTVGE